MQRDWKALSEAFYLNPPQSDVDEATSQYQQLSTAIEAFMRQMHVDWTTAGPIDDQQALAERLENRLMVRGEEEGKKAAKGQVVQAQYRHLEGNFDHFLLRLVR